MYSTDPAFGFESGFDTEETFYVKQQLPGKPEMTILLHSRDVRDLLYQLDDLLKRLGTADAVST